MQLIPRGFRSPYYISSPPYTRTSAGIRVLHLLARALTLRGYPAYIAGKTTNPLFETELLTESMVQAHFDHGVTPIVVYPEVIWGNPLDAPVVVRYLLNYPGTLGGPADFPDTDFLISYGAGMQTTGGRKADDLYLPVCDTGVYFPPEPGRKRSGSCFYAGKFKEVYNQKTFSITDGMVEIQRSGPNVQSPVELAELFRQSEFFYCYENSSLALEARLCGCPVILLPNEFFTQIIASDEIGKEGLAWGTNPEQIRWAQESVGQVFEKYCASEADFWRKLDVFIEKTQALAKNHVYKRKIKFNTHEAGLGELEIYRQDTSPLKRFVIAMIYTLKAGGLMKFIRDVSASQASKKKLKALLRKGECQRVSESRYTMK